MRSYLNYKPDQASFNDLHYHYKYDAKRRGFEWCISKRYFKKLTKQVCHYCGKPPDKKHARKECRAAYEYNGVDRKDSLVGYTKENAVPCCSVCNGMKMALGYDKFLLQIERIHKWQDN